jgi:hypothetical protein
MKSERNISKSEENLPQSLGRFGLTILNLARKKQKIWNNARNASS